MPDGSYYIARIIWPLIDGLYHTVHIICFTCYGPDYIIYDANVFCHLCKVLCHNWSYVYLIYLCQRQYAVICLEALKMIIETEHTAYFIHLNNLVARISSPDLKLKTALYLYNYLISE